MKQRKKSAHFLPLDSSDWKQNSWGKKLNNIKQASQLATLEFPGLLCGWTIAGLSELG